MQYLYLHGFASGPHSSKARFLHHQFATLKLDLAIPDLNLGDFGSATLSKQLNFLHGYVQSPLTIIGSSLGGYLALQMAIANMTIAKLILLAPAFKFSECLEQDLGTEAIAQWQTTGTREIYHYGLNQPQALNYKFLIDARTYLSKTLDRPLPILIIHGRHDTVVPVRLSQEFASNRPMVQLEILDSDHSLGNVLGEIWHHTKTFLQL